MLDTTGELQHWYAVATIVFVGKSLTARGGQNPVEPILAGKPVLFGPHMENFQAIADDFRVAEACVTIAGAGELAGAVERLLRDAGAIGRRALECATAKGGATARTVATPVTPATNSAPATSHGTSAGLAVRLATSVSTYSAWLARLSV